MKERWLWVREERRWAANPTQRLIALASMNRKWLMSNVRTALVDGCSIVIQAFGEQKASATLPKVDSCCSLPSGDRRVICLSKLVAGMGGLSRGSLQRSQSTRSEQPDRGEACLDRMTLFMKP